ncbi:MAG: PIF1 family DEAD/DEAH box helicase, partial [Patescibacteria group bacterium]
MTQADALNILKTGANVFLTGEPGSGKTFTVNEYAAYLRQRGIEPSITASTGIAATHLGGLTIHSWTGIGIRDFLSKSDISAILGKSYITKRMEAAHVLIIDEVSMLSPQTLNLVDTVCRAVRKNPLPFGGLQVIFVGDFFQLPPVIKEESVFNPQTLLFQEPVGKFAFESMAWRNAKPVVCYLTEQHRQDDTDFLGILSAIRRNEFTADHQVFLRERRILPNHAPDRVPTLFAHNHDVDRINKQMLAKIPGERHGFAMKDEGKPVLIDILKKGCLSPEELHLKIDATVMFTKNNPKEGFVNGTLGGVEGFQKESKRPIIKTRTGLRITVEPMTWAVEENGKTLAKLTQLPLRLAWAITVHKSQGMSLDAAVMDLSSVFEFGQGYVALSRVRRLSGLFLLGWNERAFEVHPEIL